MTHHSEPGLLQLHAVRLLGFADTAAIAARAATTRTAAANFLQEAERLSWVQHFSFADLEGWSLTDAGKVENERQLAAEREIADPKGNIATVYREFLPLNTCLLRAVTDWQISPTDTDAFAPNKHLDAAWDARILEELTELGATLGPLVEQLSGMLARFGGYAVRFEAALDKAKDGHDSWVDRTDVDSCHRVWFQLHEDLLATLGVDRGSEN